MDCIDKAFKVRCLLGRDEARFLYDCARGAPDGEFVELGPYFGASTIIIASVANERGLPFTTIDRFTGDFGTHSHDPSSPEILRQNLEGAGIDPLPCIIEGDSANVPDGLGLISFLFVDTDHNAATLGPELDAWLPLVMEGGVVALHDYNWPGRFPEMIEVIDRRLGESDEWERIGLATHLVAFRRV
jgi:predicted O-methyltransferase YrrM